MRRIMVASIVGGLAFAVWAIAGVMAASPSAAAAGGWDFPKADQVLLVEPNGLWHLKNPSGPDRTFWYGVPGDVPLLGDWNGDGVDTPGMYRPSSGFAYLSNTFPADGGLGSGDPSLTFYFGGPGDQVFSGDWDGDGVDTLGIFRRGKVYLTNTNATVVADHEFWFGNPADIAFGGDTDGDGTDGVFLYRPSTGFAYHTNATPVGPDAIAPTDASYFFGLRNDRFMVGDWDDDKTDTAGVFRPGNTTVYLRNSHATGPADESFTWGESNWTPVTGRVGDFVREVVVRPIGSEAENGVVLREAAAFVASQTPTGLTPWVIRVEPGTYNVWENDGETFNIIGLHLPDHSSLIGAGPDLVTIKFEGLWSTGIKLGEGNLEGFTFDFYDFQGSGLELGLGTLRNVHVVGIVDRGGTGVFVGIGSVVDTRIEIHGWGSADVTALTVGKGGLTDSTVEVWGTNYFEGVAVSSPATLGVDRSTIRSHGSGAYKCVGVSGSAPSLTVRESIIESCIDDPRDPSRDGVGIRTDSFGIIEDSVVTATPHPIEAAGPVAVTNTTLAGGAVTGMVTCTDVFDGYGTLFPSQCPGQPYLYRVNAGGAFVLAIDGGPGWTGDSSSDPSQFVNFATNDPENQIAAWPSPAQDTSVPAETPLEVFQTERWVAAGGKSMHWNFPMGVEEQVEVRLYFASGYDGASDISQRLFDVTIDDWLVLDDYDIVADVGHRVGVMKSFIVPNDWDGIDIVFSHLDPAVENPLINAIEILVPERLIAVEGSGTPEENGTALLAAMSEVGAENPEPGQEWTVKLGPGDFLIEPPLQLLEYVALEGSPGTVIRRSTVTDTNPERAVVKGADHSVLRHVDLVVDFGNWSSGQEGYGIWIDGTSPLIESLAISGSHPNFVGIRAHDSQSVIRDVDIVKADQSASGRGMVISESDIRLAHASIEVWAGLSSFASGIEVHGSTLTISNSSIAGFNNSWRGDGIEGTNATVRLQSVEVRGSGGWFTSYAVAFTDSTVDIAESLITTHNAGFHSTAASFAGSTVVVRDSTIDATWGQPPIALAIYDGDVTLESVTVRSLETEYNTGNGVLVRGTPLQVTINGSDVAGPTWTINNESTTPVEIRATRLAGGPVIGTGPVVCEDVTDENGTSYADTCPS